MKFVLFCAIYVGIKKSARKKIVRARMIISATQDRRHYEHLRVFGPGLAQDCLEQQ